MNLDRELANAEAVHGGMESALVSANAGPGTTTVQHRPAKEIDYEIEVVEDDVLAWQTGLKTHEQDLASLMELVAQKEHIIQKYKGEILQGQHRIEKLKAELSRATEPTPALPLMPNK